MVEVCLARERVASQNKRLKKANLLKAKKLFASLSLLSCIKIDIVHLTWTGGWDAPHQTYHYLWFLNWDGGACRLGDWRMGVAIGPKPACPSQRDRALTHCWPQAYCPRCQDAIPSGCIIRHALKQASKSSEHLARITTRGGCGCWATAPAIITSMLRAHQSKAGVITKRPRTIWFSPSCNKLPSTIGHKPNVTNQGCLAPL